jgi:putative ATPase
MSKGGGAMKPLADEIRPQTLDEVAGQKHLLGEGALLRRLIESGTSANLIFYGPSGTGKTTIANIIAKRTEKALYHLNATTASLQDVKSIIADVDTMLAPNGVLLYLDEIQYFNKKQQQSLLEFMENGKITLIASTTENPYFYIYNALLSRSTVFEFKPLSAEETLPAVERALGIVSGRSSLPFTWEDTVPNTIAAACGGDVRKAINAVELLYQSARPVDGVLHVTSEDALQLSQRSAMRYDREGDDHYDLLSALQKSIRGSDPDAALYYLGRLLTAGDLLSPCRRLLVIAAEDIGLAYPQAMVVTKACVDAAVQLGLPEARLPLAEAAVLLATAPKSNSASSAIIEAMTDIQRGAMGNIPRHLQNVHADSAGSGPAAKYKYPHNYPNHYVSQRYLPEELGEKHYYEYGDNKTEQAAKRYWDLIRGRE